MAHISFEEWMANNRLKICKTCNGTGRTRDGFCKRCGGTDRREQYESRCRKDREALARFTNEGRSPTSL